MQAIVSAFENLGCLREKQAQIFARGSILTALSATAGSAIYFQVGMNPLLGGAICLYSSTLTLMVREILERVFCGLPDPAKSGITLAFAAVTPILLSIGASYAGFATAPYLMVALGVANLVSTLLVSGFLPEQ